MASESVTRLYAKLKEMNLSIGGFTLGEVTERVITVDKVADEMYESLLALERGELEEVTDFGEDENDVTRAFNEKYAHLNDKLTAKKPEPTK